jgi:hypothetical protein
VLEEGGTTYNTTAVNESSVRKIKPPRLLFAVLLGITFCVMVGAGLMLRGADRAFAELEIKQLPLPTELALKITRILQTPAGAAVAVFCFLTVLLLTIKGLLDRVIKLLIGLNVAWLIVFLLSSWSVFLAVFKISAALKDAR